MHDLPQSEVYGILNAVEAPTRSIITNRLIGHDNLTRAQAETVAANVLNNAMGLPANLDKSLRTHCFLLIHNALTTRMRMRWMLQEGDSKTGLRCGLCANDDETLAHLHRHCTVTQDATRLIVRNTARMEEKVVLLQATASDFLLMNAVVEPSNQVKLLAFSLAVWRARNRAVYSHTMPSSNTSAVRIFDEYKSLLAPANRAVKKARDKTQERLDFQSLCETLPLDSIQVFTDGSYFATTEECGAGYLILNKKSFMRFYSVKLDNGTNNTAELSAMNYALRHVIELIRLNTITSNIHVLLFSDSQYVLDIISEASNPRANLSLVRTLMRLVSTIKQTNSIRFIKVPGHANVLENELVDFLAKRGAKGSTSSEAPPNQLFRRAYREALSKSYTSPFIPVECPQLY